MVWLSGWPPPHIEPASPKAGMLATDLDGTLLNGQRSVSTTDLEALTQLADHNILRVIATGRSLASAREVLPVGFPIDYLAFSSGAGIVHWDDGTLVAAHTMPAATADSIAQALIERDLDFMQHHPIPDNHRYHYRRGAKVNPDFDRRLQRYADAGHRWPPPQPLAATQFVIIEPPGPSQCHAWATTRWPDLSVIRTTSPLDGQSRWTELFPAAVDKGQAARWLLARHRIPHPRTVAVGNDYNDLALLQWANRSFVVRNAPTQLRRRFLEVASNEESGVSQAARTLLPCE